MQHVMIDLETMGLAPRGAIVSIGALEFDLNTGKTGHELHVPVSLQDCLENGLQQDESTVKWWAGQAPEARASWDVDNPATLDEGMRVLMAFFMDVGGKPQVWANAPTFDLMILRNAYSAVGREAPWHFTKERCCRTLVQMGKMLQTNPRNVRRTGTAHNALDDCKYQVAYCVRAWAGIRGAR